MRTGLLVLAIGVLPLTASAPDDPMVTATIPAGTTIIIEFVSSDRMAALSGSLDATAYSDHWFHPPCRIYLAAGTTLHGYPERLQQPASFADQRIVNDLSHELLHCSLGFTGIRIGIASPTGRKSRPNPRPAMPTPRLGLRAKIGGAGSKP